MSNPFGEVSALPVVIPAGVALFVILVRRLRARRALTAPRAAVGAALSVYAAGVVANTVFPIFLNPPTSEEPWMPAIALIPFHDYEVGDALTNVLVFVPLGVLIPLLVTRPSSLRVLTIAAGVSLAIELMQLGAQAFFAGGHVADINDFLFNVIGAAIGYGVFLLLRRIPLVGRWFDRFRWTGAPAAASARVDA